MSEENETPLLGAFGEPSKPLHYLGPMQQIQPPRRRFKETETVDYVIVGVGSAGGVLLQRLARAGFSVVGFDAGPFWDTERDWVSDEAGSHKLYWNDLRITGGQHPLALGENNSGRGVGGGSVHWAAFTPRFHPSDFEVYTRDGVGADWPLDYEDIEPYYQLLEQEIPVAGPAYYPYIREGIINSFVDVGDTYKAGRNSFNSIHEFQPSPDSFFRFLAVCNVYSEFKFYITSVWPLNCFVYDHKVSAK